jgi:hypothetical protein
VSATLTPSLFRFLLCANDAYAQQRIGACAVLPPDNIWNTPTTLMSASAGKRASPDVHGRSAASGSCARRASRR